MTSKLVRLSVLLAIATPLLTRGATPNSGTLSDGTPLLAYSSTVLTTNTSSPPTCSTAFNRYCDNFALTVNLPGGYVSAHPAGQFVITTAWKTSGDDFDLYLQNSSGAYIKSQANGGSGPEVIEVPLSELPNDSGTPVNYNIRIVLFTKSSASDEQASTTVVLDPGPKDPCILPGVRVVLDGAEDQDSPGSSQQDIRNLAVAELGADANALTFTMKVTDLNGSLPPSGTWRIYFTAPDATTYWVSMETDAVSAVTYTYGTRSGTIDTPTGLADSGSVSADGTIRIKIATSKVGSPAAGQNLTAIFGRTYQVVGGRPVTLDSAPNTTPGTAQYALVGNAFCGLPTPAPELSIGLDYVNPDTDGSFTLTWTRPAGARGPDLLQRSSSSCAALFSDDAEEPLVAGANSKWAGSEQWSSQVNPETGSTAYYIPDTADQDETLTQISALKVPAGQTRLTFDSNEDTEETFDFAHVRISNDNGGSFKTLASFTGRFVGKREVDLSAFAGQSVKLQFRMTSDLLVSAPGWYVDNISVINDYWGDLLATDNTSVLLTKQPNGLVCYRVRTEYVVNGEPTPSAFSNIVNATVNVDLPPIADAGPESMTVNEGGNAELSGVMSSDPNGDPISYAWSQLPGEPRVTLVNANAAVASFVAPDVCKDAVLNFRLTVSDQPAGNQSSDDVTVTIHNVNQPPSADAGKDQIKEEGSAVTLSASGTDPDCETLTYNWTQLPGNPRVDLVGADTPTASFTAPPVDSDTVLRFRVTVSDAAGTFTSDDVNVTVYNIGPGPNPPTDTGANPGTGNTKVGGLPAMSLLALGLLGLLRARRRAATVS